MTRDELIAAMRATAAPKPVSVTVPGWGTMYVKPPTVGEVDEASDAAEPEDGKKNRFARGAARLICDADGARVFDPLNVDDVLLLAAQPWSMLQRVMEAADVRKADDSGN